MVTGIFCAAIEEKSIVGGAGEGLGNGTERTARNVIGLVESVPSPRDKDAEASCRNVNGLVESVQRSQPAEEEPACKKENKAVAGGRKEKKSEAAITPTYGSGVPSDIKNRNSGAAGANGSETEPENRDVTETAGVQPDGAEHKDGDETETANRKDGGKDEPSSTLSDGGDEEREEDGESYDEGCDEGDEKRKKSPISHIIDNILLYATAPIIALCFFFVYLAYLDIWPFGPNVMSSYDMLAQIAPFAEHLFDVFEGKSGLFYSFSVAGGADVFGTLAYCMVSPFSFIFLLGGKGMANYMVPFVLAAKIAVIAVVAVFTLKKLFPKLSPVVISALALMYTYSGYFHMANTYINWLDFLIWMPFVLLGFRRFMQKGKYLGFSLAVAAMIYVCFSIACFSLLIIFLILFVYVMFMVERGGRRAALTKICMALVLAVGLALPIILPSFMAYIRSGRNTGLFSNLNNAINLNHMYRKLTYVLMDAPMFALGLYYLIAVRKDKPRFCFLWVSTALIFAPILVDEICLILNAGSYMSYAMRFGFLNSLLGLYLSGNALEMLRKQRRTPPVKSKKCLISTIIGAFLVLVCVGVTFCVNDIATNNANSFLFTKGIIRKGSALYNMFQESGFSIWFSSKFAHSEGGLEIVFAIFIAVAVTTLAVALFVRVRFMPKKIAAWMFAAVVVLQSGFGIFHTVLGDRNTMITYDRLAPVLEYIDEKEGGNRDGFRIKDCGNSLSFDIITADAPLTLHYRAVTVFSSVIDRTNFVATDFLLYTAGNGINTQKSYGKNAFADCLLGYKYGFSGSATPSVADNWKRVKDDRIKNIYLFENDLAFPAAFTIPGGEYSIDGNYADALDGLYAFLGGEGELTAREQPVEVKFIDDGAGGYFTVRLRSAPDKGNVYVTSHFPEELGVVFCVSEDYEDEKSRPIPEMISDVGFLSGRTSMTYSLKATGGELDEQTIKNSMEIFTVKYSKLEELSRTVKERACDVKFSSNRIDIKANSAGGDYVFVNYTAIKGYKVFVNGKERELEDNDLKFLVAPLDQGENTVSFRYTSPYILYIIIGVLVGAAMAAGMIVSFKRYAAVKRVFEIAVPVAAALLAAFIFAMGFVYPFALYIIKLYRLVGLG